MRPAPAVFLTHLILILTGKGCVMTAMKLGARLFTCGFLLCSLGCGLVCLADDDPPAIPIHYINRSSNAVTVVPYYDDYKNRQRYVYPKYKEHLQKEDGNATRKKYLDFCRGMILESKTCTMNQIIPFDDGINIFRCKGGTRDNDVQRSTGSSIAYVWWSHLDYIETIASRRQPSRRYCPDGEMSVRICMVTTKRQAKDAQDSNSLEQHDDYFEILCSSPYTSDPLHLPVLISGPQLHIPASCAPSSTACEQFSTDEKFETELARIACSKGTARCVASHPGTAGEISRVKLHPKREGIKVLAIYVLIDDVTT